MPTTFAGLRPGNRYRQKSASVVVAKGDTGYAAGGQGFQQLSANPGVVLQLIQWAHDGHAAGVQASRGIDVGPVGDGAPQHIEPGEGLLDLGAGNGRIVGEDADFVGGIAWQGLPLQAGRRCSFDPNRRGRKTRQSGHSPGPGRCIRPGKWGALLASGAVTVLMVGICSARSPSGGPGGRRNIVLESQ